MKAALVLLLSISTIRAGDIYDPSDDLITAFGSTCSTQGYMTSTAMSQASSLRTIFNSIHNDQNCSSIAQSLDSLDASLQSAIQSKSVAEQNIHNIVQIIRDLKVEIALEQGKPVPDANKIALLQSELSSQEITLIKAKTDPALSHKSIQGSTQATANVYTNATALMSSITDNSKCFVSHTTLGPQITATTLQTLSLFAPTSLGASYLMAIPGIIGHLLQTAQDLRMTNNLKMAISAKMVHAIGCSIEGITSTYCQARDVRTILNATNNGKDKPTGCDVSLGVQVVSKDLNAFQSWATTIVAGSAATSTAQAATKADALKAKNDFETLKENLSGTVGQAGRELQSMKDPGMAKNRIKSLVNDLAKNIYKACDDQYGNKGTLGAAFSDECGVKAYILSGGTSRVCMITGGESSDAYLERVYPGVTPDVGQIQARLSTILDEGQKYVAAKTAVSIQSNPQLALATSEHLGLNGKTAINFLQDSRAYLGTLLNTPGSVAQGNNKRIVEDAYKRVDSILTKLNTAKSDRGTVPEQIVGELASMIAPTGDSNHIGNEIAAIVKSDIDSRIKNGKMDQGIATVLQLSTSDSLNEFMNGNSNRAGLEGQISSAKTLTKSNLESFGNTFSEQMQVNLEDLLNGSKDDEDVKQSLGLMCVRLASLPQSPVFKSFQTNLFGGAKEINIDKYCKGQKFVAPRGNTLEYDKIREQNFNQRACSVYDFFRGSRLQEMSEAAK